MLNLQSAELLHLACLGLPIGWESWWWGNIGHPLLLPNSHATFSPHSQVMIRPQPLPSTQLNHGQARPGHAFFCTRSWAGARSCPLAPHWARSSWASPPEPLHTYPGCQTRATGQSGLWVDQAVPIWSAKEKAEHHYSRHCGLVYRILVWESGEPVSAMWPWSNYFLSFCLPPRLFDSFLQTVTCPGKRQLILTNAAHCKAFFSISYNSAKIQMFYLKFSMPGISLRMIFCRKISVKDQI